jgi:hypothetical protein
LVWFGSTLVLLLCTLCLLPRVVVVTLPCLWLSQNRKSPTFDCLSCVMVTFVGFLATLRNEGKISQTFLSVYELFFAATDLDEASAGRN